MKLTFLSLFLCCSIFVGAQTVIIKGVLSDNIGVDSVFMMGFSNKDAAIKKYPLKHPSGEFEIKTEIQSGGFYRFGINEKNFLMLVIQPGEKINITANTLDLYGTAKVTGSPNTTLFYDANSKMVDFQKQKDSLQQTLTDQIKLTGLKEEAYAVNFIKQHPKSLASMLMIEKVNRDNHPEILTFLDSNLYLEYPTNKMVQDFHAEISKMSFLKEGTLVPEISLKDKNGKTIALSSLRGKVVIVDFWATWCGPCKAEIPNLQKVYGAYHDKGLDIYSVSLDRQKMQWINGSGDLVWNSVLDEDGAVANQFGVSTIPLTILVDRDGKIIAKNLRGAQLYLKVSDIIQ